MDKQNEKQVGDELNKQTDNFLDNTIMFKTLIWQSNLKTVPEWTRVRGGSCKDLNNEDEEIILGALSH